MTAQEYPIVGLRVDDIHNEQVEFEILQPEVLDDPLGRKLFRQQIDLRVHAKEERAEDLALLTALEAADAIVFGTGQRVRVHLGSLTNAPQGVDSGPYRTILIMRKVPGGKEVATVDQNFLEYVAAKIGDVDKEPGRRIIRAMRWLRRASVASDEVEEFAALAFAYEALAILLPDPPRDAESATSKNRSKRSPKLDTSQRLRHWAISGAKISPDNWKRVGEVRHTLFHGGLTEDTETRARLASAIPFLRLALQTALKSILQLPPEALPKTELPPVLVRPLRFTAPGVVRTLPPSLSDFLFL